MVTMEACSNIHQRLNRQWAVRVDFASHGQGGKGVRKQSDWYSNLIESPHAIRLGGRRAHDVAGNVGDALTSGGLLPPFLKWAGGKRWLMPLARQLAAEKIETYYEPFVGSGAMFFALRPVRAVLSDSNEELIQTYKAIRTDWQAVVSELKRHHRNHCADYYYKIRSSIPRVPHTQAARFIYLNRTCWNGLYRVNRRGVFNTPIGTKTSVVLQNDDFGAVASLLKGVSLHAGDFERVIDKAGKGDFVFSDPPYTVRHQFNGFVKYNEKLFSWADQERLMAALQRAKSRGAKILCTNADHQSVRELYAT